MPVKVNGLTEIDVSSNAAVQAGTKRAPQQVDPTLNIIRIALE